MTGLICPTCRAVNYVGRSQFFDRRNGTAVIAFGFSLLCTSCGATYNTGAEFSVEGVMTMYEPETQQKEACDKKSYETI